MEGKIMKGKIKIWSLVLSILMILSIFTACGKEQPSSSKDQVQQTPTTEQKQDDKDKAEDSKQEAPKEKITLKILKAKAVHEVPYDQMDVFKVMEEKFNIHIEWDNPPDESFTERYNLVMASGDLPDVIMGMPAGDVLKYADLGVIIPLNDLINNHAPELKAWMDKVPEIRKAIVYPDGNIYYFPMFDEYPLGNNPLSIRQDWLEKFGMESPVTTDDWYNYWKAVKENDPNENGQRDEIPFSGSSIGRARSLIVGWGVLDGFYSDPKDGGKIKYGPIEDRYREGLEWVAKMYKEGMIDPEIATNDEKAFQGKMAQNIVGSYRGAFGGNMTTFNTTLSKDIPGFRVMGTAPLKGPYGDQIHPYLDQIPRSGVIGAVITNVNKYPEETTKWIDYFYSKEGAILNNMGIEGKHHTIQNGVPVFTDFVLNNPDGLSPKQVIGTYSFAQSTGPYLFLKAQSDGTSNEAVKETKDKYIAPYIEESKKYVLPGALPFESEDDQERRQIMADIQTYVDEAITKFIIGQMSLDEWDSYVEKVKSMNIDRVIEIYQKAFDAWNSK